MGRFARFAQISVFQGGTGVPSAPDAQKPAISSLDRLAPCDGHDRVPGVLPMGKGVPPQIQESSGIDGTGTPDTPATGWGADDWQCFYDERAAIAEYDGGLSRPEAEARAWKAAVIHWCNTVPPEPAASGLCLHCGKPLHQDAFPVLRPGGGHVCLHQTCIHPFNDRRTQQAQTALRALGVPSTRKPP